MFSKISCLSYTMTLESAVAHHAFPKMYTYKVKMSKNLFFDFNKICFSNFTRKVYLLAVTLLNNATATLLFFSIESRKRQFYQL